jgi:peptidoglycan/xylan/chitin deacetylase (PgdA/CDA1 family)
MIVNDVTFGKLLEYLKSRFQFISLEALFRGETDPANNSKPRCLLTFDDGWKDTYTTAYPLLKRLEVPAAMFVVTGKIGHRTGFWVEQLKNAWRRPSFGAHVRWVLSRRLGTDQARRLGDIESIVEWLKHMPAEKRNSLLPQLQQANDGVDATDEVDSMLTWNQVFEMSQNGFAIGAHTVSHPLLTFEDDQTVRDELSQSRATLEAKLGKAVRAFAYPNGDWDARVRRWVDQTGYECAFTTRPGWYDLRQDPYTVRRILIHEGNVTGRDGQFSPAMLSLTLAGRA